MLRIVKDAFYSSIHSQGTFYPLPRSLDRFGRTQTSLEGLRALGGALHLGLDLIPQPIPCHHGTLVSLGNVLDLFGTVQEWFVLPNKVRKDSAHGSPLLNVGQIHQPIVIVE